MEVMAPKPTSGDPCVTLQSVGLKHLKEISSLYSGTCRIGDHVVHTSGATMTAGRSRERDGWEIIDNALGGRAENLVS